MKPEDIYDRLKCDPQQIAKRPLLQTRESIKTLEMLSSQRREKYLKADVRIIVDPNKSPDDIAIFVAESILTFITENPDMGVTWIGSKI